ncbi:MAG: protein kinase [Terriglobales bacterium]|jgi:Tol biopolymer transport system component/predicted Ser/Thr protein kinase
MGHRPSGEVYNCDLMALTAGTKLGPYEIQSPLGAGGMGEVYRARDARLERDVALKVLRPEIAADPERRARFEREAKTVAALSHPNIVALYEVGNADGVEYTVSELVDGQSLRAQIIGQGAIPVRQVVELATQLAEGMAAAHAAGIVHRDLKPENVMITRDGRVKILDFGLARVLPVTSKFAQGSTSATMDSLPVVERPAEYVTKPGMVLGTFAYMSPEQARGQDADYRSDQFSFGLILYEMLSGRQAFVRDSAVETMAAIVRDEAEPLKTKMPAPLKWLVERCLEKEPTRRFDSSRDLYQQLRTLRDHFSEAFSGSMQAVLPEQAAVEAGARRRGFSIRATLALAALTAALAGACAWWLHPAGVQLSDYKYTPFAVNARYPLWSPDGKMAAYAGDVGAGQELFLRTLDSAIPQQLTHDAGRVRPLAWSPDSAHILYCQKSRGSEPDKVLSTSSVGGEPDVLWTLPRETVRMQGTSAVAVSPNGKAAAVLYQGADSIIDLYISDPIGSDPRRYPDSRVSSHYVYNIPQLRFSPNGKQLLLIRAGDSKTEESWLLPWPPGSGTPRRVLGKLLKDADTPRFAWMPDNRHIVAATASGIGPTAHLFLADTQSERLQQITEGTGSESNPTVSPDGSSILFTESKDDFDILSMSITDGTAQGLIVTARSEQTPAWAAHADSLVYVSDRQGTEEIWLHSGNGPDRPLVTQASFASDPPEWMMAPALSPDGTRVIFGAVTKTGASWLWEVSVAGGAPVRLVAGSDTSQAQAPGDWSPDGKQFVFASIEPDGTLPLKIVRTSGGAVARKLEGTSNDGMISWSPDGRWIAYPDENSRWHLVSPDGKQHRDLGAIRSASLAFSKDGRTAYGIRQDAGKWFLFTLDIETGKLHDIKGLDRSLRPQSELDPGIRFSLAPDGKSFAYSVVKSESSVWMLQGFANK